jgi:hypothetical protein
MVKISEELNYRWPIKGDRLLRNSPRWRTAITFSDQPIYRHADIWNGYSDAARTLIDACQGDFSTRPALIYPILFCYRHALEMAMKWIVGRYGRSAGIPQPDLEHDLWQLWTSCKSIIMAIAGNDEIETIAIVESCIKEFHDLDKSALAFRYSINKNGVLIKLPDVPVDVENLRDVMEGLNHFFEGADVALDEFMSSVDRITPT